MAPVDWSAAEKTGALCTGIHHVQTFCSGGEIATHCD